MTKTIASLYWEACHAERTLYGGNFHLPPVKRGDKPALLTVSDHVQLEKLPYLMGGGQKPVTIFGEEIAADIVTQWASNALGMTPECGPGIWVVRDTIPLTHPDGTLMIDAAKRAQFRQATEEEREAMWQEDLQNAVARQAKWGEFLIQQGDIYASDPAGKQVILITGVHRRAAIHYGREREWLHELKDGDRKYCQFCQKPIGTLVVKCPHCSEVVDRKRYDELTGKAPIAPPLKPAGKDHVAA